jgi:ornithine decarboxylase
MLGAQRDVGLSLAYGPGHEPPPDPAAPPPTLYLDLGRAVAAYRDLAAVMRPFQVRYAAKANPHPALLGGLAAAGAAFAIGTLAELEALGALGVAGERIACVSPGPPASLLRRCRAAGVRTLTVDSAWELRKAAALLPGAAIHVRLRFPPSGRLHYPAADVGVAPNDLPDLLAAARGLPVDLAGVAIHVGSQCERLAPWPAAVAVAAAAWHRIAAAGWTPRVLNLGGGLPAPYHASMLRGAHLARVLRSAIAACFPQPPVEIWLEPGRAIAAGAGVLAATVQARTVRRDVPWLTLDVGRSRGLPEAALGIRYPCHLPAGVAPERGTLVGPLGPQLDLLARRARFPGVGVGDPLYLLQAGAYSAIQSAYAAAPAGPRVIVLPPGVGLDAVLAGAFQG